MSKKINVGVLGCGFVGTALVVGFKDKVNVVVYDKFEDLSKNQIFNNCDIVHTTQDLASRCEVIFICVPTPMNSDGSSNISIVRNVIEEISDCNNRNIAVIKSTVPPGTTAKLHAEFAYSNENRLAGLKGVIFNPEFLTEANFIDDFKNQDRIILGGDVKCNNVVKNVYTCVFPDVPVLKTSSENAELVKYTTNCFLAVKVSFANELYQICSSLFAKGFNVEYDRVIELATLDKRLGSSHWRVPGPDGAVGWGLSCFPKDLNALMSLAKSIDVDPKLLSAAWQKNLEVRKDRDWEKLPKAVTNVKSS